MNKQKNMYLTKLGTRDEKSQQNLFVLRRTVRFCCLFCNQTQYQVRNFHAVENVFFFIIDTASILPLN